MIGTNALAKLGFGIVDAKGCIVTSKEDSSQQQEIVETSVQATEPQASQQREIVETSVQATEPQDKSSTVQEAAKNCSSEDTFKLILQHDLCLGSQQTRVARAQLANICSSEQSVNRFNGSDISK